MIRFSTNSNHHGGQKTEEVGQENIISSLSLLPQMYDTANAGAGSFRVIRGEGIRRRQIRARDTRERTPNRVDSDVVRPETIIKRSRPFEAGLLFLGGAKTSGP